MRSLELTAHLDRYPEDLRDIGRLLRRFKLTAAEVARALERWRATANEPADRSAPSSR